MRTGSSGANAVPQVFVQMPLPLQSDASAESAKAIKPLTVVNPSSRPAKGPCWSWLVRSTKRPSEHDGVPVWSLELSKSLSVQMHDGMTKSPSPGSGNGGGCATFVGGLRRLAKANPLMSALSFAATTCPANVPAPWPPEQCGSGVVAGGNVGHVTVPSLVLSSRASPQDVISMYCLVFSSVGMLQLLLPLGAAHSAAGFRLVAGKKHPKAVGPPAFVRVSDRIPGAPIVRGKSSDWFVSTIPPGAFADAGSASASTP